MSTKHSALGATTSQHQLHRWAPANQAARFALVVTAADKLKLAWQTDDNSLWILVDDTNVGNALGWSPIVVPTSVGPTYTDPFTSSSATAALVRNVPLADDTCYTITVICFARDTGVLYYKKKSSTDWRRGSGGGATQIGTDDGPTGIDQITVTGLTVIANSNGVDIKYGGSGSVHTRGFCLTYVVSNALAVAT
jgi:hypothetical protein